MYDFRLVKATRKDLDAPLKEVETLAMPMSMADDYSIQLNYPNACLLAGVVDKDGIFIRTNENPTHLIQVRNLITSVVIPGRSIKAYIPDENKLGKYFRRRDDDGICLFTMDSDGDVYTSLTNGSTYYLTKKRLKGKAFQLVNQDTDEDQSDLFAGFDLFSSDIVSLIHTDPEMIVYNIVRAYSGMSMSDIMLEKFLDKLIVLYHGMTILVRHDMETGDGVFGLEYTDGDLAVAYDMYHGKHVSPDNFEFRMIHVRPNGTVCLDVKYEINLVAYIKAKKKGEMSIPDVDLLLKYTDTLAKNKYCRLKYPLPKAEEKEQ